MNQESMVALRCRVVPNTLDHLSVQAGERRLVVPLAVLRRACGHRNVNQVYLTGVATLLVTATTWSAWLQTLG